MTLLEKYNSFKKYLNKSGGNGCQNLTFTVTVKNQFDITEGLNESQFFSFVSSLVWSAVQVENLARVKLSVLFLKIEHQIFVRHNLAIFE